MLENFPRKLAAYVRDKGVKASLRRARAELSLLFRLLRDRPSGDALTSIQQRWRTNGVTPVLFVTHNLGGGTERALQEHIARLPRHETAVVLRAAPASVRVLTGWDSLLEIAQDGEIMRYPLDHRKFDAALAVLRGFGFARAHLYHLSGIGFDMPRLLRGLGVPFDFLILDYMPLCPTIQLTDADCRYIGDPHDALCLFCRDATRRDAWRAPFAWLFAQAQAVYAPAVDVIRRIQPAFPAAPVTLRPLEPARDGWHDAPHIPPLNKDGLLRIAIIGRLTRHKGRDLVNAVIAEIERTGAPLRIDLIGAAMPAIPATRHAAQTGVYAEQDLQKLVASLDPHVVWFPALWPETFSYTLSGALEARRAVLASDLGPFAERLSGRAHSWLMAWDSTPQECIARFMDLRAAIIAGEIA